MANVDLKSLTIQGLDDTYVIPQNLNEMAGTLDVDKGGTGVNSIEDLKEVLNIGDVASENVVPVTKGGTGATTAQQARTNLGLSFDIGNNYTKLPDGTLIQWGDVDRGVAHNVNPYTYSVTFPVPFIDNSYSISPVSYNASGDTTNYGGANLTVNSQSKTKDGCQINSKNTTGAYSFGITWIAIGRWK